MFLLAVSIHGNAQRYALRGLEIYNPAYNNPAYTGADQLIQADAVLYSNPFSPGLYTSLMGTLPGNLGGAGVSFDRGVYYAGYSSSGGRSEKYMSHYNVAFNYRYTFQPWKEVKIHTGANLNAGKLNFLVPVSGIDSSWLYRKTFSTKLGAAVDYKNITAGISGHFPISAKRYYKDDAGNLANETVTSHTRVFHMYGKYESKSPRRVTFDPLVGMYWMWSGDADFSEWLGYVGGHIQIVDVVGLGFTAGSMLSVSATVNILDRVELMLAIYQGEKPRDDAFRFTDYKLNFSNREYTMQLRIKL